MKKVKGMYAYRCVLMDDDGNILTEVNIWSSNEKKPSEDLMEGSLEMFCAKATSIILDQPFEDPLHRNVS